MLPLLLTAGLLMLHITLIHSSSFVNDSRGLDEDKNTNSLCPMPMEPFRTKFELVELFNKYGFTIGAEVGVRQGHFARWNLDNWPGCKEYVLIDTWNGSAVDHHTNHSFRSVHGVHSGYSTNLRTNPTTDTREIIDETRPYFDIAMDNLAEHKHKLTICRDSSEVCSDIFPKEYFDFVYIDARRDRRGVIDDLKFFWPKLKNGGIVAGHDFVTVAEAGPGAKSWTTGADGKIDQKENGQGVRGAVLDFFSDTRTKHVRQVVVAYKEQHWHSWAVRK